VNGILVSSMGRIVTESIETRVARARDGDTVARDDLIRDYVPFVLKTASAASRKYLTVGQDDEVSVALQAFDEAIVAYDSPQPGFLAFAATVIRRRLIDYFRRESRRDETPLSALGQNNDRSLALSVGVNSDPASWQNALERRDEMERWREALEEYGLTLAHVVRKTPKHSDARERALRLAVLVAQDSHLREKFLRERKLPIDDLFRSLPAELAMSRKTVERQRDYVTAIALMLVKDFPTLREFLDLPKTGGY
jgi:RNA polymerase sigma factor